MKRFLILALLLILVSGSCRQPIEPTPAPSTAELIQILYASDPDTSYYAPGSQEFAAFPQALQLLSDLGPGAIDAASLMAKAISFPRRDAYLAAEALLWLDPQITATAIPILLDNLHSPRADVRLYSVLVLASLGELASCAVADIAPLLWDPDPLVRSAAAVALDLITDEDLVRQSYRIIPLELDDLPFPGDQPEGEVTDPARAWWEESGSGFNWHPAYGICDP
jgi:hypothetical protein